MKIEVIHRYLSENTGNLSDAIKSAINIAGASSKHEGLNETNVSRLFSHKTDAGSLDFFKTVTGSVEVVFHCLEWREIYNKVKSSPEKFENKDLKLFLEDVFPQTKKINLPNGNSTQATDFSKLNTFSQIELDEAKRIYFRLTNLNGINANSNTLSYLKLRTGKKIAKSIVVTAYAFASPSTGGINVPSLGLSVDSDKNSIAHVCKLVSIHKNLNGGEGECGQLKKVLGSMINKKARKVLDKTIEVGFSSVPGASILSPAAASSTGAIISNSVNAGKSFYNLATKNGDLLGRADPARLLDSGVEWVTKKVFNNSEFEEKFDVKGAKLVHFLAFKEQFKKKYITDRVSSHSKFKDIFSHVNVNVTTGDSATQIFIEIFKQRGLSRVIHKYDPIAIIEEPLGWLALLGKLDGKIDFVE